MVNMDELEMDQSRLVSVYFSAEFNDVGAVVMGDKRVFVAREDEIGAVAAGGV